MPRALAFVLIVLVAAAHASAQVRSIGLQPSRGGVAFTDIHPDDRLYPVNINNWWGHMNQLGRLVVYPHFDWADHSYDNFARVVVDGRTGFIYADDRWLVAPIYAYADRFAEGYAVVGDGERFGYLDRAAKLRVPIRLDGALRFREGLAAVQVGDRVGFINTRGDLAIPLRFAGARSFRAGLAAVRLPPSEAPPEASATPSATDAPLGPYGFIDKTGKQVFLDRGGQITALGDFHENLVRVRIGGQWGYLDRQFNLRIPARFDEARDFHDSLAAVRVGEQWGYIDRQGRFVIPPRFDSAGDFGQTLALIEVDGQFGYINRVGKVAIAPQFEAAEPFFAKYARVFREPSFGYIGVAGNVVWDPREALEGIRDLRLEELGRISRSFFPRGHGYVSPPPWRKPLPVPYPADDVYEYEAELPRRGVE